MVPPPSQPYVDSKTNAIAIVETIFATNDTTSRSASQLRFASTYPIRLSCIVMGGGLPLTFAGIPAQTLTSNLLPPLQPLNHSKRTDEGVRDTSTVSVATVHPFCKTCPPCSHGTGELILVPCSGRVTRQSSPYIGLLDLAVPHVNLTEGYALPPETATRSQLQDNWRWQFEVNERVNRNFLRPCVLLASLPVRLALKVDTAPANGASNCYLTKANAVPPHMAMPASASMKSGGPYSIVHYKWAS